MTNNKTPKLSSDFNKIRISMASPEEILEQSHGEVLKPETINYRTYKPERDGLFCERIFGPVKDYQCHCGKYKRIRYKGIVCDRCGVEVTEKKVRIYYERYVVIQPGLATKTDGEALDVNEFLTEEEYLDILDTLPKDNQYLDEKDPNKFVAKMGAEALYDMLGNLDLNQLSFDLRHSANTETSQQRKNEALKRLQVVEALRDANQRIENKPEWMIVASIGATGWWTFCDLRLE